MEECGKASLIIYLDGWEYWYVVWRGLEYEKSNKWMSADIIKIEEGGLDLFYLFFFSIYFSIFYF